MGQENILNTRLDRRSLLRKGGILVTSLALAQLPGTVTAQEQPPTDIIDMGENLRIFNNAKVPTDELLEIHRAAKFSLDYFYANFGVRFVTRKSVVVVRTGGNSHIIGNNMILNPDINGSLPVNHSSRNREVVHETAHLFQSDWAGYQNLMRSPRWLVEGSAEVRRCLLIMHCL